MPGVGRHPCAQCHYVAGNRRMLARHAVLIHSDKVFKCPVCPFITRYAANWYRHKRDLHGLTRVTNCEVCGFFADSTAELAAHKEERHPEHLQIGKFEDKYAREKLRLSVFGANIAAKDAKQEDTLKPDDPAQKEDNNTEEGDESFYEPITVIEEFGEEQASVLEDLNSLVEDDDDEDEDGERLDESVTFSLPLNGHSVEFGAAVEKNLTTLTSDSSSPENLGPLKVKRSYNCLQCGLLTSNPREYLYHLRDNHGEKISVFECKYCIYASKHVQKLHRHCSLVHRLLISKDPEYQKQLEASRERRVRPVMNRRSAAPPTQPTENGENSSPGAFNDKPQRPASRSRNQIMLKCSVCPYQTRNKGFLQHHEKTVHLKKRFYRCPQCGYATSERGRYTKHIRYHSLPKMRCEFCHFRTAYKWNMERHMRNHEEGAEGAFHCTACNFTTSTKQSFKSHVTNHHNSQPDDDEECGDEREEVDEKNGGAAAHDSSADWIDVEEFPNGEGEEEEEESFAMPDDDDENNASAESSYGDFAASAAKEEGKQKPPEMVWKDGKAYQKVLQCKMCDFRAAWPFELKKHEENHRSQKKHECPLCGMRFEHIAWLTKHLRRIHQDDTQAKNIAAAFELMKPTRRRPGKEYAVDSVLPMFQDVLKQNRVAAATHKVPEPPNKNSMLSTLLNKPLQPFVPISLNKYNSRYKSKAFASATNMSRQLTMGNYYEKAAAPGLPVASSGSNAKSKNVPTCNVCGYKTRWISELQRHMRVHSQEKPFQCPKCKYHCKWKGDLNRHLMKYHGIKVPSSSNKKQQPAAALVPKLKLKKASAANEPDDGSDWQHVDPEVRRNLFSSSASRNPAEDAPLDLTTKDTFPHPYDDPYDFEKFAFAREDSDSGDHPPTADAPSYVIEDSPVLVAAAPPPPTAGSTKRKYQCPFCTFATTTASRFHVHVVQHYNRRPFCCSVCSYNSNWEWDITKHIRLRNCRDAAQNKACVLLTDETGRRNYEKYEKYLVDINAPPPLAVSKPPGVTAVPDVHLSPHNVNRTLHSVNRAPPHNNVNRTLGSPAKNCSYDFRNIGSNFEEEDDGTTTPENIVVTPDIDVSDIYGNHHPQQQQDAAPQTLSNGNEKGGPDGSKWFYCRHCNFKHATKRVVISHLSVHAGIKPFRCRACGITSNWRHVIVRHVKDAHNGYMNEVEDRISYSQEGFALSLTSVHATNHQDAGPREAPKAYVPQFGCKICPYRCDKEFYIKFHMKQHRPREGAVYRCEFCPYFVKFKKTLVRHTKLHLPSSSSAANATDEDLLDFEDEGDRDSYEVWENDDSADDSIAISFDQLNQFSFVDPVSASSSPPKVKRHICEQCPYKTDNKTQYLYHKQFHRPNASAPFKCTVCSYWATMQHLLTQHMKVHSSAEAAAPTDAAAEASITSPPDRPVPASRLSSSPSDADWMDKMSVVFVKRDGEVVKMFKCNFCPMMNKKKANVRVHQKMHGVVVKNGKFACSYCDYQCLNQGGLTNHLKIHQKVPEKEVFEPESTQLQQNGDDPSSLLQHRRRFFSYFCTKCPALFKSANDLEIHSKFHGSAMQFGCTVCDYRTRQKTHLVKHLTVHSPEYVAKRDAAQGPPLDPSLTHQIPSLVKKVDQMLLLEESEMGVALKKTGESAALLQKCVFCPAPFFKTSTLAYHISLHGSEGEFKCGQCDYSVGRASNLVAHSLVHPAPPPKKKAAPRRPPLRTFPCAKCPAVFYKQDRFDRHQELHGKNYKYGCEHCDYSVRFAANLIKHRNLHAAKPPPLDADNSPPLLLPPAENVTKAATETTTFLEAAVEEKRVMFICDRCPYAQNRKDAVQSHQRRHWLRDGFKCPYCDYTSMQSGFVQSHIKMHIQPSGLFPAQAFMRYESFKIFVREDEGQDEEELLFDDQDVREEDVLLPPKSSKRKRRKSEDGSCRKKKALSPAADHPMDLEGDHPPRKVPVVVLSDILTNKEFAKWAPQLKIPKLKLTKCADSNEKRTYSKLNISYDSEAKLQTSAWGSKPNKPSLVVKISKVENSSGNEKTMYSVCTKTSEPSPPPPPPVVVDEASDIADDSEGAFAALSNGSSSPVDSAEGSSSSSLASDSTKDETATQKKKLVPNEVAVDDSKSDDPTDAVPEMANDDNLCGGQLKSEAPKLETDVPLANGLTEEM